MKKSLLVFGTRPWATKMCSLDCKVAHGELDGFDGLCIIGSIEVLGIRNFMVACDLALTDFGGIQEDSSSLGDSVLVICGTTERPEGVAAGTLKLVGTEEDAIYREFSCLLSCEGEHETMSCASNPHGDGRASERSTDVLGRDAA